MCKAVEIILATSSSCYLLSSFYPAMSCQIILFHCVGSEKTLLVHLSSLLFTESNGGVKLSPNKLNPSPGLCSTGESGRNGMDAASLANGRLLECLMSLECVSLLLAWQLFEPSCRPGDRMPAKKPEHVQAFRPRSGVQGRRSGRVQVAFKRSGQRRQRSGRVQVAFRRSRQGA